MLSGDILSRREEVELSDTVMNILYTLSKKSDQTSPLMQKAFCDRVFDMYVKNMDTISPCVIKSRDIHMAM